MHCTRESVGRDGGVTTAVDPIAIREFNIVFIREIGCGEIFSLGKYVRDRSIVWPFHRSPKFVKPHIRLTLHPLRN